MFCLSGPSDTDRLSVPAALLRRKAIFIIFAAGEGASYSSEFRKLVSSPASKHFREVSSFRNLDQHNKYLYNLLCQNHCLGREDQ